MWLLWSLLGLISLSRLPVGNESPSQGLSSAVSFLNQSPAALLLGAGRGGKPWADAGQGQGLEPGSGGTVPEGCCPGGWLVWGERPWGGGFRRKGAC